MYRFLLTSRWLGLLGAVLVAATACVGFGFWQVDRLGERQDRNDLLRRNLTAPPVPVDQLLQVGRGPAAGDEYARVRASGRYDADAQVLVRLRPYEGRVGFHVLTPLVTSTGTALLVDRGWVAQGQPDVNDPAVPQPPAGEVTVTARVRPSEPATTTGAPPAGQVSRIDSSAIGADLPYPVYEGFVELTGEQPAPAEAPARLVAPEPSEGPHLAYAFQWFLFAALALGGYVVLARREAADRRAAVDRLPRQAGSRVTGARVG